MSERKQYRHFDLLLLAQYTLSQNCEVKAGRDHFKGISKPAIFFDSKVQALHIIEREYDVRFRLICRQLMFWVGLSSCT